HSFNRPVALLVDNPNTLVFDTKDERVISLGQFGESLSAEAAERGREDLLKDLDIVLAGNFEPTSVVTEAASVRKLDQLAPENPLYKEILALREDVGNLAKRVTRRPQTASPADISALRTFVQRLVETNIVGIDRLREMIIPETTPGHNQWVEEMVKKFTEASAARAREKREQSAPLDDPWAGAPPAGVTRSTDLSDDPPF